MRQRLPLLALICSSFLAACGGGGDSASITTDDNTVTDTQTVITTGTDVADKYVGTWTSCRSITLSNLLTSVKVVTVNTKASATSVDYTLTLNQYIGSSTCAGTAANTYTETGTVVYQGTKLAGSDTVDMGEASVATASNGDAPRSDKDISLVDGNTMYLGDDANLDAEGYPTALDRSFFLVRQ